VTNAATDNTATRRQTVLPLRIFDRPTRRYLTGVIVLEPPDFGRWFGTAEIDNHMWSATVTVGLPGEFLLPAIANSYLAEFLGRLTPSDPRLRWTLELETSDRKHTLRYDELYADTDWRWENGHEIIEQLLRTP
jgi:hypothetical protein